jgi:hypothetical protein
MQKPQKIKETYELQLIKCGKATCKRCPHGPYWYAFWQIHGRTRSRYIGQLLPEDIKEEIRGGSWWGRNAGARSALQEQDRQEAELKAAREKTRPKKKRKRG